MQLGKFSVWMNEWMNEQFIRQNRSKSAGLKLVEIEHFLKLTCVGLKVTFFAIKSVVFLLLYYMVRYIALHKILSK